VLRVALAPEFGDQAWLGGVSYYRNLLAALQDCPERRIEPVIFAGRQASQTWLSSLPPFERCELASLTRGAVRWVARKIWRRIAGTDPLLERDLLAHRIDVLSHATHPGRRSALPTIAWIPDFQHRRLPDFFDVRERNVRDRQFRQQCEHATLVLVSSHAARKDLATFSAPAASKARVLHFVASVPDAALLPSRQTLSERYAIDGPYFFLPNQFWAHKNHAVVIEALALLKRDRTPLMVLATGNARDYRQPGHFPRLQARASELGLEREFRALGVVPYLDLMGLMQHAIAVVNPSRFEGWSTTVEEAKSLGKAVILSDQDVHREQAPPGGAYFDPDDAQALASLLLEHFAARDDPAHHARAEEARKQLHGRRIAFARQYEEIVIECAGRGK
jgi:glycosyltransferase involved in cell wall biosynthesis